MKYKASLVLAAASLKKALTLEAEVLINSMVTLVALTAKLATAKNLFLYFSFVLFLSCSSVALFSFDKA